MRSCREVVLTCPPWTPQQAHEHIWQMPLPLKFRQSEHWKSEKRGTWPIRGKKLAQIILGTFCSTFPDLFLFCRRFLYPLQHATTLSFLKGTQSLLITNLAISYHICLWVRDRTNGTVFTSESRSGSDIGWEMVVMKNWVMTVVLYKFCINSYVF